MTQNAPPPSASSIWRRAARRNGTFVDLGRRLGRRKAELRPQQHGRRRTRGELGHGLGLRTNQIGITALGSLSTSGTYAIISVPGGGLLPADFSLSSSTLQAGAITYTLHLTGNATQEDVYVTLPGSTGSVWQGGSGHWNSSNTGSWVNGIVPNSGGAGAVFNQTSGGTTSVTIDSPQIVGTVVLGDSSGLTTPTSYVLSGSSLTLNNSGSGATITLSNSGSNIIETAVILNDAKGLTVNTVNGGGNLAFGSNGTISGTGPLTMSGAGGSLILSPTGADTYSGGTIVKAGILILGTTGAVALRFELDRRRGRDFDLRPHASSKVNPPQWAGHEHLGGRQRELEQFGKLDEQHRAE